MAIMATDSGGGDFKLVPPANHIGICCMVVDLGRQRLQSAMYGDSIKHQVYVSWELPNEPIEWLDKSGVSQTGYMRIGKFYTLSLHENANLRADLESWRGKPFTEEQRKGFDIATLAGVPAMVNVIHEEKNGKMRANVTGVTPLPKGMDKPQPLAGALVCDDEHLDSFDLLPEWLQKKINEQVTADTPNMKSGHAGAWDSAGTGGGGGGFGDDLDDDIPFATCGKVRGHRNI